MTCNKIRLFRDLLRERGINWSRRLEAVVSLLPDTRHACVLSRPCSTLNHEGALHSCPLIYVSRIKRHGLNRSAATFLYSHRHSWRTAGMEWEEIYGTNPSRVLKTLASAAATSSSFSPSPRSSSPPPPPPSKRNRGIGRRASQSCASVPQSPHSVHVTFSQSVQLQLPVSEEECVDTTDTLWRFLLVFLYNDNFYKHQK